MPAPGIITGSNLATALFGDTTTGTVEGTRLGVFGTNPGSTPKRAINNGRRDAEYRETMARLFVEIPSGVNDFLASISPETQALARVLATGGSSAGSGGTGFIDFLLTGAQESFAEKAQIVDTLTDNYVAFYSGEQPPLFQYSGTVLNTYQDDQRVWLFRLYREVLRGTRLANRSLIARLRYDSFIVSGYIENLDQSLSGDNDHQAGTFRFSMRVQHMTVFTPSIGAPTIASTPATETSVVTSTVTPQDPSRERVTTGTPEIDPAAAAVASEDAATRARLRADGLSDDAIDAILAAAAVVRGVQHPTDPREVAAERASGIASRVVETVTYVQGVPATAAGVVITDIAAAEASTSSAIGGLIDATIVNPLSAADDGLGSTTNTVGDVYGTVFGTDSPDGSTFVQELPEREGLRRRGGLGGV